MSAESAISSFDMAPLYTSWLRTIIDSQRSAAENKDCDPSSPIFPDCDGADTDTSPHVAGLFGNRPADPSWGAALDVLFDLVLRYYNRADFAENNYAALTAYADYLLRIADVEGVSNRRPTGRPATTAAAIPHNLTSSTFFLPPKSNL